MRLSEDQRAITPQRTKAAGFVALMSSPRARLDDWLARHPGIVRRILIPAPMKWEIRDKPCQ